MRNITWTCAGVFVALTIGAPAIADDTELLLLAPDQAQNDKPNMLFILDTSGSMTSNEGTIEPYDSSKTYDGNCDPKRVYWTDVDVLPVCDGKNKQYINDDRFFCRIAIDQMSGIGSFSDTMVQYRGGGKDGRSGGPRRWQYLAPGYTDKPVECQQDSGKHGDGRSKHLWAASGTDLRDPFTKEPDEGLSWGSAPRNLGYTVFDGNYLNWKASPANATISRIAIVRAVTKAVLKSITGVNVGLMRFNDRNGGPVIKAISDLETDRAGILATIDSLTADGRTPLAETMYEAALYWRGMNAHFGENIDEHATDPEALDSATPENYKQPATNVCSKNYNVLLTDGKPNDDHEAQPLAPLLPGFQTSLSRKSCDGALGQGMCLDDITEYLAVEDIDAALPGDQFVTTHTIGFAIDLPILRSAAERSGGQYFLADDVESLARALLSIVGDVTARNISFSSPAVSVNAFNRTQNLNDVYLTVFSPKTRAHWPGNLKKYRISDGRIVDAKGRVAVSPTTGLFDDAAQSFWTTGGPDGNEVTLGGAANALPAPASRKLYTNNGFDNNLTAGSNALTPSNTGSFAASDFGLTGAVGEPAMDDLIRWMRGEDINDEDSDSSTTVRNAMGDALHSQPAAVVYGGSATSPDVIVYTATNDGYLHAVDGITGVELWSFVPKELLTGMTRLFFDPRSQYKVYGIDGDIVPVVADRDNNGIIDGGDFVYLLFGQRRGGNSFYALDVTDKNTPRLMWSRQLTGGGQSWSRPTVARVDIDTAGQNSDRAVVIIGGGYDSVHDTRAHPAAADTAGAGIHMLDLVSGAELWRAGRDAGASLQLSTMTRSIPAQIRVADMNGDGFADRMYASDMGGQLLRFDITSGQAPAGLVAGGVIAQLGADGLSAPTDADTRRFYNPVDVSIFTDRSQNRRFISLSIGSGYRAHPLDNGASDRFYSVRDPDVFNQLTQAAYDNYIIVTDSDLVEVSGRVRSIIDPARKGWKFSLPDNQKVLAGSVTFDDSVFFVGFSPESGLADVCQPSQGRNFLYRVSVENGDPVVNNLDSLDPGAADDERVRQLAQGGIAPTPAFLFPSPDDPDCTGADCTPPPIACVGVECFDPGFANNPVRTLWTQDGIE
ncbi:MAG: pilus assembly protein [Woeseia sp.]